MDPTEIRLECLKLAREHLRDAEHDRVTEAAKAWAAFIIGRPDQAETKS